MNASQCGNRWRQTDAKGQDLPSDQVGVMSALLPRAAREADMLIGSEVPG